MEDILSSIRKILNESDDGPRQADDDTGEDVPATPDSGILLLSEDMMVSAPDAVPSTSATPIPGAVATPRTAPGSGTAPEPGPREPLVAPAAAQAAASSLGTLVRTLAQERSTAVSRGGPTIEDLVRDEIRPVLKQWLDNHLPPLVERLVRAEIERMVGQSHN